MIKNWIFDIGNVLIRWNPKELVHSLTLKIPEFPTEIAQIPNSKEWKEFDRGTLNSADIIKCFSQRFPETHVRTFMQQSYSTLVPIQKGWNQLQDAKKAGKKIYILSNLSHEFRDYLLSTYTIFSLVDGAIYSCEVGCIKPEDEVYQRLLSTFQLSPSECCFFDDKPENLQTANRLGIQGQLVTPE